MSCGCQKTTPRRRRGRHRGVQDASSTASRGFFTSYRRVLRRACRQCRQRVAHRSVFHLSHTVRAASSDRTGPRGHDNKYINAPFLPPLPVPRSRPGRMMVRGTSDGPRRLDTFRGVGGRLGWSLATGSSLRRVRENGPVGRYRPPATRHRGHVSARSAPSGLLLAGAWAAFPVPYAVFIGRPAFAERFALAFGTGSPARATARMDGAPVCRPPACSRTSL